MPRTLTWLGLVGGPLIIVLGRRRMFGGGHPHEWYQGIATIPEAPLGVVSLGIYPLIWGFRRVPIRRGIRPRGWGSSAANDGTNPA